MVTGNVRALSALYRIQRSGLLINTGRCVTKLKRRFCEKAGNPESGGITNFHAIRQMMANLTPLPAVTSLSSRVTRVLGCNPGPFTLQGTNCYLVGTGASRILIDAGEQDNADFISNLNKTLQTEGITIQEIVITHWHRDHTGGIEGICQQACMAQKIPVSKFKQIKASDPMLGHGLEYSYVSDGHVFSAEGATLQAVYTPGHADDHMSLWMKEENSLFTGDTVLGEGTCVFEDLSDYMSSLDKIRNLSPTRLYPAHGPTVENPEEHIGMYISHRLKREGQIVECLQTADKQGLNVQHIVHQVYPGLSEHLNKGAINNVTHHLSKLIKEGRVCKVEDKYMPVATASL